MSSGWVSQHPLRKKPVIGLREQASSVSPSTFLAPLRRPPPPLSASSLNISGILALSFRSEIVQFSPLKVYQSSCGAYLACERVPRTSWTVVLKRNAYAIDANGRKIAADVISNIVAAYDGGRPKPPRNITRIAG